MDEHRRVLQLAAQGNLPNVIREDSDLPFGVVRELVESGLLTVIDDSGHDGFAYLQPRITMAGREYLRLSQPPAPPSDVSEVLADLERMRDMMVAVSTGGPRIDEVNRDYRALYTTTTAALNELGLDNTIPFSDLWDWYGRWSSGDLPSYRSRREFLGELFNPLLSQVRQRGSGVTPDPIVPTGWPRVDRAVGEARQRLASARTEEQFQTVGLLCREILISLAQAVYDPERDATDDGVNPSDTDAKRMIAAYLTEVLTGSTNKVARQHTRAAYDLAVELQHRRTATFRQAALCLEATTSIVNVVAILSGRRDPE